MTDVKRTERDDSPLREGASIFLRPVWRRGSAFALFAALFVSLFAGAIFSSRQFAYRDISHFYYPLYERIQKSLDRGVLPLWDPTENLGQPLLANPTGAIFYPGKLIFFLPHILPVTFGGCFKWYVTAHIALAFGAFYAFGRRLGSRRSAFLGSLAYAFGGPVLFQHTNLVFLVGAAYLPLLFLCGVRLIERRTLRELFLTALVLALMTLGGDPETAYLGGGALFLFAFFFPHGLISTKAIGTSERFARGKTTLLLLTAAIMAILLCAVQILPSIEMTAFSDRTAADISTYHFSLGPWRLAEFLWPDIGGRLFPENSRWLLALPGERYLWLGTLYLGLMPFLAALFSACFRTRAELDGQTRRKKKTRVFFTWTAILALLGAFGGFGLGWLFRQVGLFGETPAEGPFSASDPVGGIYWLMNRALPGFAFFRYPAKLTVFAAFALSSLSVFGFDMFFHGGENVRLRGLRRSVFALLIVSLLGGAIFLSGVGGHWIRSLLNDSFGAAVSYYGPCDFDRAGRVVGFSFFRSAVLLAIFTVFLRDIAVRRRSFFWRITIPILLAADLFASGAWQTTTFPESILHRECAVAEKIDAVNRSHENNAALNRSAAPIRFYRENRILPDSFLFRSSPNRPAELVDWYRATLFPKFHAEHGFASVAAGGTMRSADYALFTKRLRELERRLDSENRGEVEELLAFIGAEYLLCRSKDEPDCARAICLASPRESSAPGEDSRWPRSVSLWRLTGGVENLSARVRIYHEEFDPKLSFRAGFAARSAVRKVPGERAVITAYEPERITLDVLLQTPGYLLLTEQYWPGWSARIRPQAAGNSDAAELSLPIKKECRFMRRVDLPAGEFVVDLTYRPISFFIGLIISMTTVLMLAVYCFFTISCGCRCKLKMFLTNSEKLK